MRVLGLDTATRATTVALLDTERSDDPVEARDDPPPRSRPRHAGKLLLSIDEVLGRAGLSYEDLDRVVVGTGPGTFTGLRIGIATARGLAHGLGIPLAGVSTLVALATGATQVRLSRGSGELVVHAQSEHFPSILAVLDARRGEAFAAAWSVESLAPGPAPLPAQGERAQEHHLHRPPLLVPQAITPDALADKLGDLPAGVLAVGEGAVAFRAVLEAAGATVPADLSTLHRVTSAVHCQLGAQIAAGPPDAVTPDYLRLPDAEIARRARSG